MALQKFGFIFFKSAVFEAFADFVDGFYHKALVVDARKNFRSDFVDFEKMMQVRARIIFATFAITFWVERGKIMLIFCIFNVDAAIRSVKRTVSGHASWADAVERVAAILRAHK